MDARRLEISIYSLVAAIALVLILGAIDKFKPDPPPPLAMPSVPSLIPPKCDCGPKAIKTFAVTCPYCQRRLIATPPKTGEIGEVAKDEAEPA